ncbi:MAG: alpha-L-fucosidase [Thermoguttaceae bacterium]
MRKSVCVLLCLVVAVSPVCLIAKAESPTPSTANDAYFIETNPSKVDMDKRTEELKNLRWGTFICWSFSTFSGKEWTSDPHGPDLFNATGCDTDQWCKTMKEAEMGYVLFLTKHHDGFCLWDTATTELKVTNSPLKRDVLADLKKSCDKYGIKLALYFSEGDWTWKGSQLGSKGGPNPDMKKAQLKELLTQYGPIEYIWFDHAIGDGGLNHEETVKFCKELQPACFIGFNHGPAAGDIRLGEMGRPGPLEDTSAAGFNHGHMVGYKGYRLAEFTYPILPPHEGGAIWFYSLARHENLVHSANKLYKDYLGAVKFGNIFALDVGPNYAGKFRDVDIQTLREVGQMIRDKVALPVPLPVKTITASSVWQDDKTYGPEVANDGQQGTRWGAAANSQSGWLQIDFEKPTTVDYAVVDESSFKRTTSFKLEYLADGSWKTIIEGGRLGPEKWFNFPPVNATSFRLNILSASDVPTINEFQLYKK